MASHVIVNVRLQNRNISSRSDYIKSRNVPNIICSHKTFGPIEEDAVGGTYSNGIWEINTKILIGKPVGKRLLRRPKYKGTISIRIILTVMRFNGVDRVHLAEDRNQ